VSKYKVVNGTSYHEETADAVIRALEEARGTQQRIRLRYGFTEDHEDVISGKRKVGLDWCEEYSVEGTVSRSGGTEKIPLLIHNARSTGGGAMLDNCVVRIIDTKTKRVLYSHPAYHRPAFKIIPLDEFLANVESLKSGSEPLNYEVLAGGEAHARFRSNVEAERWVRRMSL